MAGNTAAIWGGGAFNADSGSLTVSGSTLSANSAQVGGAIMNYLTNATLTVSGSTLSGNSATYGGGGIENSGTSTVRHSTLSANFAPDGGGIDTVGTLTVSDSTLSDNSAYVSIPNNANTIEYGGGGAAINGGGTVTVTNCTLSGNTAGYLGGGIGNSGTLTVSDSTLSDNTVLASVGSGDGVAGGIFDVLGTVTLLNDTIAANSAEISGGVYVDAGHVVMHNTLVANNSGGDVYGKLDSASDYNLIGDGSGGLTNSTTTPNLLGVNPLLATLGNYGGSTQTMALLPGSPAIDAGSSAYENSSKTDQRGEPIVRAPDIGAFESQGFTIAALGGNNQSVAVNTAFPNALVTTVSANKAVEPVAGGVITFTAPASGASASFTGNPATIGSNGQASVTATANGTTGSYTVSASATGITSPAKFSLDNT